MAVNKANDLNNDGIVNQVDIDIAASLGTGQWDAIRQDILKNGGNLKQGVSVNPLAGKPSGTTPGGTVPTPVVTNPQNAGNTGVVPNSTAGQGLSGYYSAAGTGTNTKAQAWVYDETTGQPKLVGNVPDTTGKFDNGTYAAGDEITWWYNKEKSGLHSPLDIDNFKIAMWKAGAYGSTTPVIDNGRINDADTAALRTLMNYVQLNAGTNIATSVSRLANYYDTQGVQILSGKDSSYAQKHLPRQIAASNPNDPRYLIQDYAEKNNISVTQDFINNNATKVANGDIRLDDVTNYLRDTYVIPAYPAWKDQLLSGSTVRDIAQPYAQKYADLMGIKVEDVKLNNPLIVNALNSLGHDNKPAPQLMQNFEESVKKDPAWVLQSPEGQKKFAQLSQIFDKAMGYGN